MGIIDNSEYKYIEIGIPDDIKEILSSLRYSTKQFLKFEFAEKYDRKKIHCTFDPSTLDKSLSLLEKKLKKEVEGLDYRSYNRIENIIFENINKLESKNEFETKEIKEDSEYIKKALRKYENSAGLHESIILGNQPIFVRATKGSFEYTDYIEEGNYRFYPIDNILTHNPIPYSFTSKEELEDYIKLAREETFSSMFEKVIDQYEKYVNAEEHTLVIFAADTVYSYFQNRFGNTHYNILVGDPGSGKNSALFLFKVLGYRVFYVTSASAANYNTFLGEIQEGQGTIAEDEADDIGSSSDKKNILKAGYAAGGTVPKVGFTNNGKRFQECYLPYCHKWLAMEKLPYDNNSRGISDRTFPHYFMNGEVKYNIKEIWEASDSELNKDILHLRKLLFAFKLINYYYKFPEIRTNLKNRDAELTHFLLRMFYGGKNFERIRSALSRVTYEKTANKSNSIEASIIECLILLSENEKSKNREIISFTNEEFNTKFKEITDAQHNGYDYLGLTFILPDGTKVGKVEISKLLKSKFKAKATRTNHSRGYHVKRKDMTQISKQYVIIKDIKMFDNEGNEINKPNPGENMTEVTQVTDFKGATPSSSDTQNDEDEGIILNKGSDSGENSEHFFNIKKTNSNENNTRSSSENIENQIEGDSHVSQGDSQIKDKTIEKRDSHTFK